MKLEQEIKQSSFSTEYSKSLLNILVTADRVSASINTALKPFGLSKEQFNVLRILRGQHPSPCSLQLVRDRMISRSSNATRLVEKLRSRGLVERTVCPLNRRRVDLLITQQGLDLLAESGPVVEDNAKQMKQLSEAEASKLNHLLDKFRG